MALASSSLVTLRLMKETVFGQTPTTGNCRVVRMTGESLDFAISKESSKEINANRTVASVVPVTASASGAVNAELAYGDFDDLFEGVLQSAWAEFGTDGVGVVTSVDCDAGAGTITAAAAPTGADAFTNLRPGQWFRLEGIGPNADRILRVHPTTAPTATVLTVDPNTPVVDSTGENIQIQSSRLTHGKQQVSFSLERENSDIGVFINYKGMTPSKLNINIASGSLSALTFDFMGKGGMESNATQLPGAPVPPTANEIHSGVSGATNAVWMDGAPITATYVKSVSLDFDNSLRSQEAVGTLGAVAIAAGTINCTANVSVYFANKDLFTKFRQNQNTSLIFASTDMEGNGYIITLPNVNITSFKSNAGGKDQDQMAELNVTALEDRKNTNPALRRVVFIDRIGKVA